jgi:hypothetical protein
MVREAREGMIKGVRPELVGDCTGGTYLIKDSQGEYIGVFKPMDEEPYAPENPKGLTGSEMNTLSPIKMGVGVGHAAIRECACYLLDFDTSFVGVPPTVMLRILRASLEDSGFHMELKCGSFQKYRKYKCLAEELSPSVFSDLEVQKIAVFDIRVLNGDRHAGNILVVERGNDDGSLDDDLFMENEKMNELFEHLSQEFSQRRMKRAARSRRRRPSVTSMDEKPSSSNLRDLELVPIDHGYSLPDWRHLEDINQEWMFWPQASRPLDRECLEYIAGLDPDMDATLLRIAFPAISEDCIFSLYIGTTLLQHCILHRKCTLLEVAKLLVRPRPDQQSPLERVLNSTLNQLQPLVHPITKDAHRFLDLMVQLLDAEMGFSS